MFSCISHDNLIHSLSLFFWFSYFFLHFMLCIASTSTMKDLLSVPDIFMRVKKSQVFHVLHPRTKIHCCYSFLLLVEHLKKIFSVDFLWQHPINDVSRDYIANTEPLIEFSPLTKRMMKTFQFHFSQEVSKMSWTTVNWISHLIRWKMCLIIKVNHRREREEPLVGLPFCYSSSHSLYPFFFVRESANSIFCITSFFLCCMHKLMRWGGKESARVKRKGYTHKTNISNMEHGFEWKRPGGCRIIIKQHTTSSSYVSSRLSHVFFAFHFSFYTQSFFTSHVSQL